MMNGIEWNKLDISDYKALGLAIVEVAARDYWHASHDEPKNDYEKVNMEKMKQSCEEFFRSGWFEILIDANYEPEDYMKAIQRLPKQPDSGCKIAYKSPDWHLKFEKIEGN